jgi:hypothetical protein
MKKFSLITVLLAVALAMPQGAFAQQKDPPKRSVMFADLLSKQTKTSWSTRKKIVKRTLKKNSFILAEIIEFKIPVSSMLSPAIAEVKEVKKAVQPSLYGEKKPGEVGSKVTLQQMASLPNVSIYTITAPSQGLEVLCCSDIKEFPWLDWYYFRLKPGAKIDYKPAISVKFLEDTDAEFDLGFETEVATREFMYSLASAPDRAKIKKNVDDIKKQFAALKDKTKCISPGMDSISSYVGCGCKGDVLTHIINTQCSAAAAAGAVDSLIPCWLPVEYSKEAELCTIKSQLAYHIACYYGQYPTFEQYYRQCYVLFGNIDKPNVTPDGAMNMAKGAVEDFLTENVPQVLAKLAPKGISAVASGVPLVSTVIKFTIGSSSALKETKEFGRKAADWYSKKGR